MDNDWLLKLVEHKWCFFCVSMDFLALFILLKTFSQLGAAWGIAAAFFAAMAAVGLYLWLTVEQVPTFGLMAAVGTAGLTYALVNHFLSGWLQIGAYVILFIIYKTVQGYGWKRYFGA